MPIADLVAELEAIPMSEDDTVKPVALAELGAWVAFADGRFDVGRARTLDDVSAVHQGRLEARLFAARCALLAGDARGRDGGPRRRDEPRAWSAGRATPSVMAIRAGIAALEGRSRDAMASTARLLREWRDLGLVWDEALCAIDMATLLDPSDPEVSAAADAAASS